MRRQADLVKLVSAFTGHMRARRKALGLTQEQLAERSGFSTNYIARLELGMSVPSLATLVRLSKALRVGIAGLLEGECEPVEVDDVCAALLMPLSEAESGFVLHHLRSTVEFVLSLREARHGDSSDEDAD